MGLYQLKRLGSRILPKPLIKFLQRIEALGMWFSIFYYSHQKFNHARAQKFEYAFGVNWMRKGHFLTSYAYLEQARKEGPHSPAALERITANPSFFRTQEEFNIFCDTIAGKRCLEIGASTDGFLVNFPWVQRRIVIDPLSTKYRTMQLQEWDKTLFEGMTLYGQEAERLIPELMGTIDGAIICRNTLDHTTDPWKILQNMSSYAAPGCLLLFWADIWHLYKIDPGHRNIIRDPDAFEDRLKGLGFDILRRLPPNPEREGFTIDYGCIAKRQASLSL